MSNLVDVFKQAMADEVKATIFYRLAAETTEDDQARMVFLDLVNMEENHAEDLINKVKGTSLVEGWDPKAYLEALESSTDAVISEDVASIIRQGNVKAILEMAKEMEVNASGNYQTLAKEAKEEMLRNFFAEMVKEEENHVKQMDFLLLSLDIDEEDRPGL